MILSSLFNTLRRFRREPVSVLFTLSILALVTGAGAVVFTLVDAILLDPLPFHEPQRLVRIETLRGGAPADVSMLELEDLRRRTDVFEDIAAYRPPSGGYTLSDGEGPPYEAPAVLVTHNLFSVLGVDLARGTTFPSSYDLERSFGIVMNDRIFRGRFGSDDAVFDRVLTLDGAPNYTVFGVMPPGFDFPVRSELYRSIYINERSPNLVDRSVRRVRGVARLAPGVSFEQAHRRVADVGRMLAAELPDSNAGVELRVVPLADALIGNVRPYLVILGAAALLLLLIGSVNASNLLLTRALGRERELTLRAALGSSRSRLAGSLLGESLLISTAGVAVGLFLGQLGLKVVNSLVRFELPSWIRLSMDASVVGFAVAAALLLGLATGLLPALRLSKVDAAGILRSGRHASRSPGQRRIVRALLVVQVALALVLLAGTGALLRSFRDLVHESFGFHQEDLLSFKVNLPWFLYSRSNPESTYAFHHQVLEGLAALPPVESVALTTDLPFTEGSEAREVRYVAEGQADAEIEANPLLRATIITPTFFGTLGIPLLRGRPFTTADHAEAPRVVIVNQAVAQRFWPGEDPIGRRLRLDEPDSKWSEVVGVVGDVRRAARDSRWHLGYNVYSPEAQVVPMNVHYVLRVAGVDPTALVRDVEQVVWAADPKQPIWDVRTMDERLDVHLWREHTVTWLAGAFAVGALLLAAVGLYAALSESIRRRRHEIGLRMAVGADSADISRTVLRDTAWTLAGGAFLGLAILVTLVPWLAGATVFLEPPTWQQVSGAVTLLVLLAALCVLHPVRRALVVDPAVTLREE